MLSNAMCLQKKEQEAAASAFEYAVYMYVGIYPGVSLQALQSSCSHSIIEHLNTKQEQDKISTEQFDGLLKPSIHTKAMYLCESVQGRMHIKEQLNQGATFQSTLPASSKR